MSPTNENKKELLSNRTKPNKNMKKQAFGNRYSINDIRRMFILEYEFYIEANNKQIKINVVTQPILKHDLNKHLITTIQKFIRGYLIRRRMKSLYKILAQSVDQVPDIVRMNSSSSNTLERVTNQQDKLIELVDDKEDYNKFETADIVPEIPKEEMKMESKPKLQMLN